MRGKGEKERKAKQMSRRRKQYTTEIKDGKKKREGKYT